MNLEKKNGLQKAPPQTLLVVNSMRMDPKHFNQSQGAPYLLIPKPVLSALLQENHHSSSNSFASPLPTRLGRVDSINETPVKMP
jgi:hypothetical protein